MAVAFPTLGHFTPLPGIIARIEGPSMGNFIAERVRQSVAVDDTTSPFERVRLRSFTRRPPTHRQ